jgi:hypothetical protein
VSGLVRETSAGMYIRFSGWWGVVVCVEYKSSLEGVTYFLCFYLS